MWRPASEAEAAGARAVFIEWMRVVRGVALDGPAGLEEFRRAAAVEFAAAITAFVGLPASDAKCIRNTLLRGRNERPALIAPADDGSRRVWSRADLLHAAVLPEPIPGMLAALTTENLSTLAASHLLDADTAPDDCLVWAGDPAEPWPLGAWLLGASVMLAAAGVGAWQVAPAWRG
jgi:hypothetical protein